MTLPRTLGLSVVVSFVLAGSVGADVDPELVHALRALKDAEIGSDGPALVAFFRSRTLSAEELRQLAGKVRDLGNDSFEVREKASADLIKAGRSALPFLRSAAADPDLEIARRVKECLDGIELSGTNSLIKAAARVLSDRKPAEAAEALLGFLPFSEEESVEDAVIAALRLVGLRQGRPDSALFNALTDSMPMRRAAAAHVLGRLLKTDQRQVIRPLLKDEAPRVRYEAAAALASAGERSAVPVLIALLENGPLPLAWQSEDLLFRLPADPVSNASLGVGTPAERRRCRETWEDWWKTNESKIDLGRLAHEEPFRGLSLVCEYDGAAGGGRVCEFGKDGQLRWNVSGLQGPNDVQLLPNGRILVAERNGGQVTERDRQGKILWKYSITSPIGCQRLPGENTLITTFNELVEVNSDGKQVHAYQHRAGFRHAVRLRNGNTVFVASTGEIVELDTAWKPIRNITPASWGSGAGYWASIEPLPGSRYLVVYGGSNRIVEVDQKGSIVWECSLPSPVFATRLRNGNTLISCFERRSVVEVDRQGKEMPGRLTLQGRPFAVRRY